MSLQNITKPNNLDLYIKYAPSNPGSWGVVPNNVSQALDELAASNPNNVLITQGDMIVADALGDPIRLPIGTNNEVLTVVSGNPSWEPTPEPAVFVTSPLAGDGTSLDPIEISTGTVGQVLQTQPGGPVWSSIPGLGTSTNGTVGTSDATPTTLLSIPVPAGKFYYVWGVISYFEIFNVANSGFFTIKLNATNSGIGSQIVEKINSSAFAVTANFSVGNINIQVTGGAGVNLTWNCTINVYDPI